MTRARRLYRTTVATPTAALLLVLSAAVPIMERADSNHAPVVESEHAPGTCPTPHDHTVCTQVGANHAAPGGDAAEHRIEVVRGAFVTPPAEGPRDGRALRSWSARAPPTPDVRFE